MATTAVMMTGLFRSYKAVVDVDLSPHATLEADRST